MQPSKGTTDEDIGRPGAWTEGRYQSPGQPLDQSVLPPQETPPDPKKPVSTPVTRQDYVFAGEPTEGNSRADPPGGDAG
jgi:hypothetical protein